MDFSTLKASLAGEEMGEFWGRDKTLLASSPKLIFVVIQRIEVLRTILPLEQDSTTFRLSDPVKIPSGQ
jgi:hypothetical protein